jgi:hypothetical protein
MPEEISARNRAPVLRFATLAHPHVLEPSVDRTVGPGDLLSARSRSQPGVVEMLVWS